MPQSWPQTVDALLHYAAPTAIQSRLPSSTEVPESYTVWRERFIEQRLRILYLVGLIVNPIFSGLDYLAYRDHLSSLAVLRLVLELGLLLGYLSLRLQLRIISPNVLVALWVLIPNVCITHMILLLGNFNTTYYNGLGLVVLTAAVIVPVASRSRLVGQIGTLLYFYAALFVSSTPMRESRKSATPRM